MEVKLHVVFLIQRVHDSRNCERLDELLQLSVVNVLAVVYSSVVFVSHITVVVYSTDRTTSILSAACWCYV
mgnify:CR=1 FL=1